MEEVGKIGYWYVLEHGTYITIYGSTKPSHLFRRFVLDKLVLQEVAYHTLVHRVGAALTRDKKLLGSPMPFYVGSYNFKDGREAQVEVDILTTFHFRE
jgi:hypothetical protein